MSSSLAREAIELFNDDNVKTYSQKQKDLSKSGKLKGVHKTTTKNKKAIQPALSTSAFDEKWRYKKVDRTLANMRFIKEQAVVCSVDPKAANVILEHHKKKQSARVTQKADKASIQSSVFTDKDFDDFEKEYTM